MIDLNKHRAQIYSQSGEDGIIQKIFETLNINTGWYCEFGAGDGNWIPNTKKLREEGWKGVLIEGDAESFKNLKDNLGNNPDVELINSYVSCEESESLDYILSNTDPTESYTIEYDKNHRFNSDSYYGATPGALNKIAEEKGYFLVASTPRTNLFYCRKEFANNFKKMELAEVDKGIGWPISKKEMIKY